MTPTVERGLRAQICSRRGKRSDTGGDGFLLGGVMRRFEEKGGGGDRNCNCLKWLCGEHLQPQSTKKSSHCELVVPENDKPMAFRQQEVRGRTEWLHRLDHNTLSFDSGHHYIRKPIVAQSTVCHPCLKGKQLEISRGN